MSPTTKQLFNEFESAAVQQLFDEFEDAAMRWGWERDQGFGERVSTAERLWHEARAALIARLDGGDVRISKDGSTAIDPDYYWRPIDANTPRGVKLQLLTEGGIAIYGQINGKGDDGLTDWAPLPKRRKK